MYYRNLSGYLREQYGKRLKKICIDGGFTCPNRDGTVGVGGCIFCGERGAGEHINPTLEISEQVASALKNAKDEDVFIAYFQNFTGTYEKVEVLRERYNASLIDKRIKILAVGTRPDAINEEVARLLASYLDTHEVWVELGLQTASDETARVINRGYTLDVFDRAVRLLTSYGIKVVVHVIVGLPGETGADAVSTVRHITSFPIFGIKIHSLYVMEGTRLAEMYREKRYTPPTLSEYADTVAEMLGIIPETVVIHRITGDCPEGMLLSPEWSRDKHAVIGAIEERMRERGITQGSLIKK